MAAGRVEPPLRVTAKREMWEALIVAYYDGQKDAMTTVEPFMHKLALMLDATKPKETP